ncbi:uncharacterized protein LOC110851612 [Folsomia candida]|uniref:uncharacterized protein LOC110851612 n=1 Tax=Folsomia candida TaxID=158441 RepID=UPI000B8F764E|nr:uncharacterized protein LOC110851612 [Folsomia candida]
MNLTYLQTYSVEGQLTFWGRGHNVICWSSDNQVALVQKKGVNVYDCRQNTGAQAKPSPTLTVYPSRIDVSHKLHISDTGNVTSSDVLFDEDKQNIFDLMRDHILRPHGHDSTIFHNYVTKAAWSPIPVYRGRDTESRCILGVITSTHQLFIYGQRNRRFTSDLWTEPWETILDITETYNKYLCDLWKKDQDDLEGKSYFDTYKERLYEIAITDFIWIPDWKLDPDSKYTDEVQGTFKSYFMTFHASGDMCLWKIVASKTVMPKYSVRVVYRKQGVVAINDIVSTTAYSFVSADFGLLLVGTNKGKILSFIVSKSSVKQEMDEQQGQQQKYGIGKEQCLWEEDLIRVEHLMICPLTSGRRKIDIIAVKNPNIVIATTASLTEFCLKGSEFSIVKVPYGPIVGIQVREKREFLLSHEPGQLSLVSFINGELECMEHSSISIFDPQKSTKKKAILIGESVQKPGKKEKKTKQIKDSDKRLIFQGLALSPNKTMMCVARTVGVYYDHLQIRRPTQIVFYSLLPPTERLLDTVRELYAENDLSLRGIADVLVPFRFALRGKFSGSLFSEIFNWAIPLEEKKTQELQLLLWCLRVFPKTDPTEWDVAAAEKLFNPSAMKELQGLEALHKYRIELVLDRIMQRRCESLIRAVLQNQDRAEFSLDEELNKQCLKAMVEFLNSKSPKSNKLPKMPQFSSEPHIPMCHWCKGPLEFPLEMFSFDEALKDVDKELMTGLAQEQWSGFKWNVRRHPVKEFGVHKPEICILTLLPLQFPYRRCSNCYVSALFEPAFGQLPYCPLCNAMMYPNQVVITAPHKLTKGEPMDELDDHLEMESLENLFTHEIEDVHESESDSESEYVSDSSDS